MARFLTKIQSNEARELDCLSQCISGYVWLVLALLLVSLTFWLCEINSMKIVCWGFTPVVFLLLNHAF